MLRKMSLLPYFILIRMIIATIDLRSNHPSRMVISLLNLLKRIFFCLVLIAFVMGIVVEMVIRMDMEVEEMAEAVVGVTKVWEAAEEEGVVGVVDRV